MSIVLKATKLVARLEPGLYTGALMEIEERNGQNGQYLLWRFAVDNGDDGQEEVTAISSTKFGTGSKARGFCEAILNRAITPGEEVNTDILFNEPCQLLLTTATLDDGGTVNRVEKILPRKRSNKAGVDDVPF